MTYKDLLVMRSSGERDETVRVLEKDPVNRL